MDDEFFEEGGICIFDKRGEISVSEMIPENILSFLPQVAVIKSVCKKKNTCSIVTAGDKVIDDVNFKHLKSCNMLPEIIKEMLDKILCATISMLAQQKEHDTMQDDNKKNRLH